MKWLKDLTSFVQNVAKDDRIPEGDKRVLVILMALIASPLDIIPDWIPVLGLIDDILILAIILDYFFNHLDQAILLSHYPWDMKSFIRVRRFARFITFLTPPWIRNKIWKFKPNVYEK